MFLLLSRMYDELLEQCELLSSMAEENNRNNEKNYKGNIEKDNGKSINAHVFMNDSTCPKQNKQPTVSTITIRKVWAETAAELISFGRFEDAKILLQMVNDFTKQFENFNRLIPIIFRSNFFFKEFKTCQGL